MFFINRDIRRVKIRFFAKLKICKNDKNGNLIFNFR